MSKDWGYGDMPDQSGKIVLITGANSGLGFFTARDLLTKSKCEKLIMACRSKDKALAAMKELGNDPRIEFLQLDLADLESVKSAAADATSRFDRLDTLVLNAGLSVGEKKKTKQGFEMTMGSCHFGHFVFTAAVWPLVLKSKQARVAITTSMMHSKVECNICDDLNREARPYDRSAVYAEAKLANLYFAKELARRTSAAGLSQISVVAVHPGFVNSEFYDGYSCFTRTMVKCFGTTGDKLSLGVIRGATDQKLQNGEYLQPKKWKISGPPIVGEVSEMAKNADIASQLWSMSEDLTKQEFKIRPTSETLTVGA